MKKRQFAARMVLHLLSRTRGVELMDFWAWEMTPMPMGTPSWRQIWVGFSMSLGLDFVSKRYLAKTQAQEEEVMAQFRKQSEEKA